MRFLFWNTYGRALTANVGRLATAPGADVVFLSENTAPSGAMVSTLSAQTGRVFRHVQAPGCLVQTYTSLNAKQIRVVVPDSRFIIFALTTTARRTVLITVAHLPSKLRSSPSTQRKIASDLAEEISKIERRLKTVRGILIGDLNMNPFDPGMIEADALHAVSAKQVATQGNRVVNGKPYPMFYNPMWSHMGDGIASPPGTFYHRTTNNDCIFFHMLDQILVRPSLIPLMSAASVQVLTGDGVDQFLSPQDIPRKGTLSDHLPIHLELNL